MLLEDREDQQNKRMWKVISTQMFVLLVVMAISLWVSSIHSLKAHQLTCAALGRVPPSRSFFGTIVNTMSGETIINAIQSSICSLYLKLQVRVLVCACLFVCLCCLLWLWRACGVLVLCFFQWFPPFLVSPFVCPYQNVFARTFRDALLPCQCALFASYNAPALAHVPENARARERGGSTFEKVQSVETKIIFKQFFF